MVVFQLVVLLSFRLAVVVFRLAVLVLLVLRVVVEVDEVFLDVVVDDLPAAAARFAAAEACGVLALGRPAASQ